MTWSNIQSRPAVLAQSGDLAVRPPTRMCIVAHAHSPSRPPILAPSHLPPAGWRINSVHATRCSMSTDSESAHKWGGETTTERERLRGNGRPIHPKRKVRRSYRPACMSGAHMWRRPTQQSPVNEAQVQRSCTGRSSRWSKMKIRSTRSSLVSQLEPASQFRSPTFG